MGEGLGRSTGYCRRYGKTGHSSSRVTSRPQLSLCPSCPNPRHPHSQLIPPSHPSSDFTMPYPRLCNRQYKRTSSPSRHPSQPMPAFSPLSVERSNRSGRLRMRSRKLGKASQVKADQSWPVFGRGRGSSGTCSRSWTSCGSTVRHRA